MQKTASYKAPTLKLTNVKVKNMLYDYQSLVNIETNNILVARDGFGHRLALHFGNYEVQGTVQIEGSTFEDSAFSQGMIFSAPVNELSDFQGSDGVYRYQNNQDK